MKAAWKRLPWSRTENKNQRKFQRDHLLFLLLQSSLSLSLPLSLFFIPYTFWRKGILMTITQKLDIYSNKNSELNIQAFGMLTARVNNIMNEHDNLCWACYYITHLTLFPVLCSYYSEALSPISWKLQLDLYLLKMKSD